MAHAGTMAWHSVKEAVILTNKSRRTLYRYMAEGRLSYRIGDDGDRQLETSELIRVFGSINQSGTEKKEIGTVPSGTNNELLAQLVMEVKRLQDLTKSQSKELADIKQELKNRPLLEHKPVQTIQPPSPEDKTPYKSIIARLKEKQKQSGNGARKCGLHLYKRRV